MRKYGNRRKRANTPPVILQVIFTGIVVTSLLYGWFVGVPRYNTYRKVAWEIAKVIGNDSSFLTIQCNPGRLGNQMCTYATLYGLAQLNNRTPYGQSCTMMHLTPYFYVTSEEIDNLPKSLMKAYPLGSRLRPKDADIPRSKNILTGHPYPFSRTFYQHVEKSLKKQYQFHTSIVQHAQNVLMDAKSNRTSSVLVGVHVRRTDYCKFLKRRNGREADKEFFLRAMDYFRKKYRDVIFVIISDDRKWCNKTLGDLPDVVLTPDPPTAAFDLAVLANCNHTIITYGTFGFWGAYLAGGDVVYFADYLAPNSALRKRNDNTFPHWIGISTAKPDFWKKYKGIKCS